MRRFLIISLLVGLGLTSLLPARADELQIQESAPDRYVVVKGDTLWDISGRFLKQPWRWPEIWRLNKEQIKDPHWIYPGDVIVLDRTQNPPKLSIEGQSGPGTGNQASSGGAGGPDDEGARQKLGPSAQSIAHTAAIPAVPVRDVQAFMGHPLVMNADAMAQAPRVIAFDGRRTLGSTGDTLFATGALPAGVKVFQIFRPGPALKHPDSKEILAYRADYVADARISEEGETARLTILKGGREVAVGDRLMVPDTSTALNFVPNAPGQPVAGRIISTSDDQTLAARHDVVLISLGAQDGLLPGNILAVYPAGEEVALKQSAALKLPETRSGLLFVFRTFERVSYALVVQSQRPLNVLDAVRNP
jgi:hypothetical protein